MVIYSIVLLILEQVTQYSGTYNITFVLLWYLPVEIFGIITSVLARVSTVESINWIYVIPSLFASYIFVLFGEKPNV